MPVKDKNPKNKETEKDKSKESDDANNVKSKKKSKFSVKILVILFVLLLIGSGGGYFAFIYFNSENRYPNKEYKNITLDEEILKFIFYQTRDFYKELENVNRSIVTIDSEIERIDKIGEKFPDQKKITDAQKAKLKKMREKLLTVIEKFEKQIKELYVFYNVNKLDGLKKIQDKKEDILKLLSDAMASSRELVEKIDKNKDNRNTVQKFKDQILDFLNSNK